MSKKTKLSSLARSEEFRNHVAQVVLSNCRFNARFANFGINDFKVTNYDAPDGQDFHVLTFTSPVVDDCYIQLQFAYTDAGVTHYLVAYLSNNK